MRPTPGGAVTVVTAAAMLITLAAPSAAHPHLEPGADDSGPWTASVTFDHPQTSEGIVARVGDEGQGSWVEPGGIPALATNPDIGAQYIYGDIDDALVDSEVSTIRITVEYFDAAVAGARWQLSYDATSNAWKSLPSIGLNGSETWKTAEYTVSDAQLSNRENGDDFRIDTRTTAIAFRSITVERLVDAPTLTPGTLGNVFPAGTAPTVEVSAGDGAAVTYRLYDDGNNLVTEGAVTMEAGAGTIETGALPEGYYTLEAIAAQGEQTSAPARTSLAVVAPQPDQADSPFGAAVSSRQLPSGSAPLVSMAGASYYRPSLVWEALEPEVGQYAYPTWWQQQSTEARDAGLTPLPICVYNNPLYDGGATPYTDEGREAFANYCVAQLQGYADLGNPAPAVEVYNEFNAHFGDIGDGPANSTPEYYAPLLQATYEAVKAASPETLVLGPAVSWPDLGWLETLFQLGALDYMDVVSLHYPGDPPESAIANLQAVDALIREYNGGESKPIWVTEWGWSSRTGGVDEATQAAYAARSGVIGLANGVEMSFWYDFANDGVDPGDHESNFGLVRNVNDPMGALTPKPSYASYATMTRMLAGTTYAGSEEVADGVTAYRFDDGGSSTTAVWSTSGTQTITIRTARPVTVVEMTGQEHVLTPWHGRVELTVTDDPVYLVGTQGRYRFEDGGQLTLTGPTSSLAGDDIELTLSVDSRTPVRGLEVTVGGVTVPVEVPRGATSAEIPVVVPDAGALGTRTLEAVVTSRGEPIARLSAAVEILSTPISLTAAHVLRDGADVLAVEITNDVATEQEIGDIAWSLGGTSGSQAFEEPLGAGETVEIDVPTTGLSAPGSYPWSVTLSGPHGEDTTSGTLVLTDPESVVGLPQQTITVDGVADDLSAYAPIDLDVDGEVQLISDWGGAADLGGDVWWTWDDENLYLTAAITDDVHNQPGLNDTIWTGDSIQIGVVAGTPGESVTGYYEYGVALTTQGAQAYRWNGGGGILPNGPVDAAQVAVTRDEETSTTLYEMALPWSQVAPFDPGDRLLSLTFLVNENDGATRRGWIEWGSGIGQGKDPSKFVSIRLDG